MFQFLSADEAREQTQENIRRLMASELIEVFRLINESTAAGCHEVTACFRLRDETVLKLRELGYEVDSYSPYDGFTVRWYGEGERK